MKRLLKQLCLWTLILAMVLSGPASAFAQVNHADLTKDRAEIINKKPVTPAKPAEGKTAEDLIKNPDQPAIYTLRTDYKVQKGEKYEIDYQPYIASVGEAATADEQKKVNKEITLPDLAGYDKSKLDDSYTIDYDTVKNAADGNNKTGDATNGFRYQANKDYRYKAKANKIKIKHLFQDMEDFTKYTNPGGENQPEKITTQSGNTGSTMEVSPLNEVDRRGFVPEADYITMQVPEDATDFMLEYRYNRAHYNVDFDTMGGTPLPTRTYYYDQEIPKIEKENIPTKIGCDFLGWKPSHDLQTRDGKTYKANQIIKKADGKPALDLDVQLKMPALLLGQDEQSRERLKFTAVWKDKVKADYAIQFWVEKSDHADGASLLEKYDYMGTRVYKDQDTGSRPNLDKEPVKGLKFPDLDQKRLDKIWANARFNRGKDLYLNKFFVYNQDLTASQNGEKTVSATGKTVYNIYYDRQVYDLYFTKSNALDEKNTFYPEIYGRDQKKNELVKLGGPGNLYHYKARFNELMYGWPNDAMQTKGFTEGYQSFGWGPNYTTANWPVHLDTPPYRLNADEFLDMAKYDDWGGYVDKIDDGAGGTIKAKDFRTLSFGIKQDKPSIPHHMDFWMDGFKPKETIIRYDLVRTKADTADPQYTHRYPKITGFTPYAPYIKEENQEDGRVNEDRIDGLNDEREEITPYPGNGQAYYNIFGFNSHVGEPKFIPAFFSNADEFGDPLGGEKSGFKENGYLQFHYKRNKYSLRFNYDPSIIRDDSYFDSTNQLDTFYEFPLKVLSPDLVDSDLEREDKEYFKEDPKNLIDNPENLQTLGLTDLVFTDKDGKLKVKRPKNLSDQMVFKGWALDPAGTKLVWENPKETMPFHPLNLYAKWGEPDYKWKVTFDPAGGSLKTIKEEKLTTERKKIQEGDIGQEEVNIYAKKGYLKEGPTTPDGKQIFTVIQRQKLVKPVDPVKKGYDFMGWEVIRYKKNDKGDYTDEVDTSYRDTYKVPELYSFGNDVVSPIYLKAIWVPNQRVDVKVTHHFLDKDCKKAEEPLVEILENKRTGYYTATTGDQQSQKWILAPHEELKNSEDEEIKALYKKYNDNFVFNNSYFQNQRIEPEKIKDPNTGEMISNPAYKGNEFHFFYRPFRQREYTVNYIDEKFKGKANEKDGAIIDQEPVTNGNRHYDARNYRPIPGWKLTSDPQQQLFFDVDEKTNDFLGINGTGKDEITFYYKDVRVIEVPGDKEPPKGYVRVTFKADKGGSFKDKDGNSVTELHYDVIKGLKSDLLPVPGDPVADDKKEAGKYYVTPETGKKFVKWDEKPLLNKNTLVENETKDFYVFTAKFEWSGLTASGLVRTEAFKDPNGKWTNAFAPTIEELKKQLVWKEKDQVKDLPAEAVIKLYDEAGNELKSDEDVFKLVKEQNKEDKDQLVRTVNIKAKVTFTDGKDPQELDIPITVYKNVYEALNKAGDKPLFLKEAEGKEAKDGGLKNVTGEYVKVTVKASKDFNAKDDKIYYVNKNAWVEIPEVKTEGSSTFVNWTADKAAQNEGQAENGIFDFGKRHKFTENTVISPSDAKDVVEQKQGEDKPKVPDTFVKVIVKTTDKATTESTQTFWVNPTKDVTIPVANPTGKSDQEVDIPKLGKKKVNYIFKEWQKVKTGESDDNLTDVTPATKIDLAKNQYADKVTVIEAAYKKSIQAEPIVKPLKTTKLDTPQGKEITNDDLIKQITPQEGKEIESIEVISKPNGNTVGNEPAKVIVKYKDGSTQGTNDNPVVIPVEVHKNIIPEAPGGKKPEGALDNYVKVIFKAGTGGSVSGDLVYYVSPEVEVDMTESAGKITKTADVGYVVNGGTWSPEIKAEKIENEKTYTFNFVKSKDIVEKTGDDVEKPVGYVTVKFIAGENGEVVGGNKIYYVNPEANIKLVDKATQGATNELVVPEAKASDNYGFTGWVEEIDYTNPIKGDREHVAKFTKNNVTLTYKAGEGATGDVPADQSAPHGGKVVLANADKLSKTNYDFDGWKIGETIYKAGEEVTLNENTTATAQWTPKEYTVMFDLAGGTIDGKTTKDSIKVKHGKTIEEVDGPIQEGKVFMGWKNKGEDAIFDFTKPITADKVLVAQWQEPVQKINDGDPVEEQFIKVTFLKGDHGTLKEGQAENLEKVTYKVAKDLNFADAQAKGLVVPGIVPAKYYKAKAENSGWDKALDLNLEEGQKEKVFTAQYEPEADVIPVDSKVTEEDQIKKEKPEGMVLVQFVVDDNEAYMDGITKYYVAKNKVVDVPSPLVFNKNENYHFNGWLFNDEVTMKIRGSFAKDTVISDKLLVRPEIHIKVPTPGVDLVKIEDLTAGASGKLEVISGGQSKVYDNAMVQITVRQGRKRVTKEVRGFKLDSPLKKGDQINFWATNDNGDSDVYKYIVQ